jgi:hypothetical protein
MNRTQALDHVSSTYALEIVDFVTSMQSNPSMEDNSVVAIKHRFEVCKALKIETALVDKLVRYHGIHLASILNLTIK